MDSTTKPSPVAMASDLMVVEKVVPGESDSQSRWDALTGNWTMFAPRRGERPADFTAPPVTTKQGCECPFCVGHESCTPPTLWQARIGDTKNGKRYEIDPDASRWTDDWSVRVVANKFPVVNAAKDVDARTPSCNSPLLKSAPVHGGHEVIIESNDHTRSLTDLSPLQTELVFTAYRDRLQHFRNTGDAAYASVFKNVGPSAGASLAHSHSQLIATDFIPSRVKDSFDRVTHHRASTGCCLMCDLVREERRSKSRVIARDDQSIAFCPFASHLPMLVRVTTLQHAACYEDLDAAAISSVSRMVYRVVSWLEKLLPGTSYNYCLSTKPFGLDDSVDAFHWSVDIFPRMTQVAGFEWGSGCMINPTLPEDAAACFRQCAKAEDPRTSL